MHLYKYLRNTIKLNLCGADTVICVLQDWQIELYRWRGLDLSQKHGPITLIYMGTVCYARVIKNYIVKWKLNSNDLHLIYSINNNQQ